MKRMLIVVLLIFLSGSAGAVENISLQALFTDKALLVIDGARHVLSTGQTSKEGVRLVSTDTKAERAVVEINGKRRVLKLDMVATAFQPAKHGSVTLWAGSGGYFHADGAINGLPVRFLVDTGATSIALSSDEAKRLGIDYRAQGHAGYASTASGVVRDYSIKLDRVEVGSILLHNVDAGVIEGSYPREALLGMSFLGRLDMKRKGNRMELTQR